MKLATFCIMMVRQPTNNIYKWISVSITACLQTLGTCHRQKIKKLYFVMCLLLCMLSASKFEHIIGVFMLSNSKMFIYNVYTFFDFLQNLGPRRQAK